MDADAIETVGPKRTAWTPFLPAWIKHEVVSNQLASSLKELGQGFLAAWSVKIIFLVHLHPGQLSALLTQLVPKPGKLLLLSQKLLTTFQPFCVRNYLMVF